MTDTELDEAAEAQAAVLGWVYLGWLDRDISQPLSDRPSGGTRTVMLPEHLGIIRVGIYTNNFTRIPIYIPEHCDEILGLWSKPSRSPECSENDEGETAVHVAAACLAERDVTVRVYDVNRPKKIAVPTPPVGTVLGLGVGARLRYDAFWGKDEKNPYGRFFTRPRGTP